MRPTSKNLARVHKLLNRALDAVTDLHSHAVSRELREEDKAKKRAARKSKEVDAAEPAQ